MCAAIESAKAFIPHDSTPKHGTLVFFSVLGLGSRV